MTDQDAHKDMPDCVRELRDALDECVRELIATRDVLYDSTTTPDGTFDCESSRAKVLRLDAIIDRAIDAMDEAPRPEALPRWKADRAE